MEIRENRNLKIIVKALKISIAYIVSISLFFPISAFYPAYKMKQLKIFNNKEWNKTTILSVFFISLLGFLGYDKDWAFLGFFLFLNVPEFLFRGMIKYTKLNWRVFDTINASSLVTTVVLALLSLYITKRTGFNIDEMKQGYLSITEMSEVDFNMAIDYITKNRYTIMFLFAYIGNFSIYWTKYKDLYRVWKTSYYMLSIYVVAYIFGYFYPENIYALNISNIITIMYTVYGFVVLPEFIPAKIDRKIAKIVPFIFLFTFPKILFIVGAIISFVPGSDEILGMCRANYEKITKGEE